jgi:hypothetical protein
MKKIYLTGGAFGMIYQMGALSAAKDKSKYIFYGCSAGALTAVMILLGYTDDAMLKIYDDISNKALEKISKEPYNYDTYNLTPKHFEVFALINKDCPDAYRILTKKKLHVGVTMETGFRWFKRFRSNEELFNILLCSFHVPILCSYNAVIDGVQCLDGGFGCDIDIHLPRNTVVICPKHTESNRFDVLNGEMPVKFCATPPPPKERMYYYNQGSKDMISYIKNGKCSQTTTTNIDETIIPNNVWWFFRRLQPDDTINALSKLFV